MVLTLPATQCMNMRQSCQYHTYVHVPTHIRVYTHTCSYSPILECTWVYVVLGKSIHCTTNGFVIPIVSTSSRALKVVSEPHSATSDGAGGGEGGTQAHVHTQGRTYKHMFLYHCFVLELGYFIKALQVLAIVGTANTYVHKQIQSSADLTRSIFPRYMWHCDDSSRT